MQHRDISGRSLTSLHMPLISMSRSGRSHAYSALVADSFLDFQLFIGQVHLVVSLYHLCFEQAQPKMYHSPKVDDEVDVFFFNFLNTYFRTFFF